MAHQHDIHSWRAWYADGAVYNSRDHAWRDLPEVGCITLLIYKNSKARSGQHHRIIYGGTDCIGLDEDGFVHQIHLPEWTGKVEEGLIMRAVGKHPDRDREIWKLGQAVSDEHFERVSEEAFAAKDPP